LAKTEAQNIVALEKIPEIFCNQYDKNIYNFEIIKKNVSKKKQSRQNILQTAQIVKEKLESFILSKKVVSFLAIQEKFNKYNLSTSALNNLFRKTRENLAKSGVHVLKIKNGYYEIKK
jgi:uncharacterized protein YukE